MAIKYILKNKLENTIGHGLVYKKAVIYFWNFSNIKDIIKNYFKCKNETNMDIFDYKKVLGEKFCALSGYYRGNNFYGIEYVLKRYTKIACSIPACIEHGIYFGSYFNEYEVNESGLPVVLTMSKNRKNHINQISNKSVLCVGPYIVYSKSCFKEDSLLELKKKFGRTLLVFPVHSTESVKANYEIRGFANEINRIKNLYNYKTVLVCMYFTDILSNSHKLYEDYGFQVVTAGYRENKYFLDRLRTFIDVSDMTMSNAVGTHVGYAVSLNKSHYIFSQDCGYAGKSGIDNSVVLAETLYDDNALEKNEVKKAFLDFSEVITKEQTDVVEKYWGLSLIKTPEELSNMLSVLNTTVGLFSNDRYYSEFIRKNFGNI